MSRKEEKKNVSSCRKAVSVTIVLDGGFYDRLFFFLSLFFSRTLKDMSLLLV